MEDRLVELLGVYGLSEREARILIFLTKNGPCGAGELAKATDIRRMEAYRLLKRLLDRGVVVSTAGKPIKYQAESLEGTISILADEQRGYVKKMDDAKPELVELWKNVPRAPQESFEQRFRIIQGREQIYNSLAKMVEQAKATVSLMLTKNDIVQAHVLGIGDKLVAAAKRGVKVEVVTIVDGTTLEAVEALTARTSVRHSEEAGRSRLVVADGTQTLVSLVLDDSKGMKNDRDVAIWTDSRDYAEMMSNLYGVSFAKAEESQGRLEAVKAKAKVEDKVNSMVGLVKAALSDLGWTVESPGKIVGESGAEYEFAAVLSGEAGQRVGVDVVFGQRGQPPDEAVTAAALKKLDIKHAEMAVIAVPYPEEQTASLATLLGVTVVDGSNSVGAASSVRSLAEGAA